MKNVSTVPAEVNVYIFATQVALEERFEAIFLRRGFLREFYFLQILGKGLKRKVGTDIEEKFSDGKLFDISVRKKSQRWAAGPFRWIFVKQWHGLG